MSSLFNHFRASRARLLGLAVGLLALAGCGTTVNVGGPQAGDGGSDHAVPRKDAAPGKDASADRRKPGEDGGAKQESGGADATSGAPDSSSPNPCGDAGVTFQLAYDGLMCLGTVCGEEWLSIVDSNDASVPILPGILPCSQCDWCAQQPTSCYHSCPIVPPIAGPETFLWNGQIHPFSACDGGQACTTSACAVPGAYVATMCVHAPGDDGGDDGCFVSPKPPPTCKTFSFQWPPSQEDETVTWSP